MGEQKGGHLHIFSKGPNGDDTFTFLEKKEVVHHILLVPFLLVRNVMHYSIIIQKKMTC